MPLLCAPQPSQALQVAKGKLAQKLELVEEAKKFAKVLAAVAASEKRNPASWIEIDKAGLSFTIKGAPAREELNEPEIREQLVVEYYSR